ncbi:hypothetical protein DFH06DRAFT_997719, partial [Mycena polygramma]
SMAKVPRWKNLKHFSNVTTEEYTDGQAFLDILKCILPCIVQLLDSNSALMYEKYCKVRNHASSYSSPDPCGQRVQIEHGKDFKFYKQHQCAHVFDDITDKGVPTGYSTRPGEGFHQEVKEAFEQTNFKNTDPQVGSAAILCL